LQDPSDKCYSMCDERLFAVFQKEHIYMIRMDSALLWRALGKKRRESGEEDEGEEERRRGGGRGGAPFKCRVNCSSC
jgi:hypothetical protein